MKTLSDFYRLFPNRPAIMDRSRATAPLVAMTVAAPAAVPAILPANDDAGIVPDAVPRYRARDYGTGYGRSSGYAQDHSDTAGFGDRLLRVG